MRVYLVVRSLHQPLLDLDGVVDKGVGVEEVCGDELELCVEL